MEVYYIITLEITNFYKILKHTIAPSIYYIL